MLEKQTQEQVTLEFVVEQAHRQFEKTMLSTRTKVILIGGFKDEGSAIRAYLSRSRPDLDRRKKLSSEDQLYVSSVEEYAASAKEYIDWIREDGGHPIWREALVAYCTSFENCLKAIAVALHLVERDPVKGLSAQVIIPSSELSAARRIVSRNWSEDDGDTPRVRRFFEKYLSTARAKKLYPGLDEVVPDSVWDICSAAFQVRNVLVHNLGYMPQTIQLGPTTLHASWEVELTQTALKAVAEAFGRVLQPFGPDWVWLVL